MKKMFAVFTALFLFMGACAHIHGGGGSSSQPPIIEVGVDPTITWDAVTTDCNGATLTGIGYNVYAVGGAGPIPTTPAGTVGCGGGQILLATGTPLNSTPIPTNTYNATLASGQWTIGVEAVAGGNRSSLSATVTVQVVLRPGVPKNIVISKKLCGEKLVCAMDIVR